MMIGKPSDQNLLTAKNRNMFFDKEGKIIRSK